MLTVCDAAEGNRAIPVMVTRGAVSREGIEGNPVAWEAGFVSVFDGAHEAWVDPSQLYRMDLAPQHVPRVLAHAAASPSPPAADPALPVGEWSWLTAEGLMAAHQRELRVPQAAIPHIVGKGGRTICAIENKFAVIVGLADTGGGEAVVTVWGPPARVAVAGAVIDCVARGARSILSHFERFPPVGH